MSMVDRTRRPREARKPVYLAFAKVGNGWQKIGAAWNFKSGENGFSIQVTAMPINWDGRMILAVPMENGLPKEAHED